MVPLYVGDFEGNLKTLNTKYAQCFLGLRTSIITITYQKKLQNESEEKQFIELLKASYYEKRNFAKRGEYKRKECM